VSCCPAVTGRIRRSTAVRAQLVPKFPPDSVTLALTACTTADEVDLRQASHVEVRAYGRL
jgi:hypothetical protein